MADSVRPETPASWIRRQECARKDARATLALPEAPGTATNDDDDSGGTTNTTDTYKIVITAPPPASVPYDTNFTLTAAVEDENNNVYTSFNGSITVVISTNPDSGVLGGTVTMYATQGVAKFTDLSINKPDNGYQLEATTVVLNSQPVPIDITGTLPHRPRRLRLRPRLRRPPPPPPPPPAHDRRRVVNVCPQDEQAWQADRQARSHRLRDQVQHRDVSCLRRQSQQLPG